MIPQAVLERFALKPLHIRQMKSDQSSFVAAVECSDGNYVVKAHRRQKSRSKVECQLELRRMLRLNGFPFLPPLLDTLEESLMEFEGQVWTVGRFVCADAPFDWTANEWSQNHCEQAAEVLASLHSIGYRLLTNGVAPVLPVFDSAYFRKTWKRCRSVCDIASRERSRPDCFMRSNFSVLADLAPLLDPFNERLVGALAIASNSRCDMPALIVHGDFHPGNILFVDGKASVLLDLEYASIGSPLIDLAYACVMFFASCDITAGINKPAANHFLSHYNISLSDQLPWKNWFLREDCAAEFRARIDLAAFLMLFWAIEGLASCDTEAGEKDFAYGLRLSCFLLNSSHRFAIF